MSDLLHQHKTRLAFSNSGVAQNPTVGGFVWYDTSAGAATVFTVAVVADDLIFVGTGDASLPGVAGTLDLTDAAFNTWGEVAASINATDNWKFILAAGRFADDPVNALAFSAVTAPPGAPVQLLMDTDTELTFGYALGPEGDVNPPHAGSRRSEFFFQTNRQPDEGDTADTVFQVHSGEYQAKCTGAVFTAGNGATDAVMTVTVSDSSQGVDTQIMSVASAAQVTTALVSVTLTASQLAGLVSSPGRRLVVRGVYSGTGAPTALTADVAGYYGPVGVADGD